MERVRTIGTPWTGRARRGLWLLVLAALPVLVSCSSGSDADVPADAGVVSTPSTAEAGGPRPAADPTADEEVVVVAAQPLATPFQQSGPEGVLARVFTGAGSDMVRLAGVGIQVRDESGDPVAFGYTDEDGEVLLQVAGPGSYDVTVDPATAPAGLVARRGEAERMLQLQAGRVGNALFPFDEPGSYDALAVEERTGPRPPGTAQSLSGRLVDGDDTANVVLHLTATAGGEPVTSVAVACDGWWRLDAPSGGSWVVQATHVAYGQSRQEALFQVPPLAEGQHMTVDLPAGDVPGERVPLCTD